MRTLHNYLTRQMLATLLMTVAVFTFVLLLGNGLREILPLLVNRQVALSFVLHAVALLIPYVLVFALPMGMLTAALLVFGRFSADQELTAVRANGVSLVALVTPVLLLSLAMCSLAALFNMQVAPQCRVAFKTLLYRLGFERPTALLPEGKYVRDFPGFVIFVGKINGAHLREILIYQLNDEGQRNGYLRAPQGQLQTDPANGTLTLKLSGARGASFIDNKWQPTLLSEVSYLLPKPPAQTQSEPKISEMNFIQLRQKILELEKQGIDSTPAQVQLHRQVAYSFACFGFTLVGIPLGIRTHRRETSFGVAVALILVLLYYSFIILGQALETRPEWGPHLIVWLPNFLFQAVGAVLLWRANRGA